MFDDTSKIAAIDISAEDAQSNEPEKTIRCKQCDHDITKPSLAIQPHEHTFRNPFGVSFHIACYADAPGAADVGVPTLEATWFPNYAWSMALCGSCKNHIGWWFHGPDKFAGLIVTRLLR